MLIKNKQVIKSKINKLMREKIVELVNGDPGITLAAITGLLPELIFEKFSQEDSDIKLMVIDAVKHAFLAVNFLADGGKIIKIEFTTPSTDGPTNLIMLFPWGTIMKVTGVPNTEVTEPTLYT